MLFQLDHNVKSVIQLTISLVIGLEYSLCNKLDFYRSLSTSSNNIPEGKIVGGRPVKIESYPSSVILFNRGAQCGSSILNSWAVLTAAHCFDQNEDVEDMTIHAGCRYLYDYDAQIYEVAHLVKHEHYNQTIQFGCDIAVLFLMKPIAFSDKIKKALLPNSGVWMKESESNFEVTGWGWTKYGGPVSQLGLQMTNLRYIPLERCGQLHQRKFTPDMFCLYGDEVRDSCKGDSGGGVIWKGMIVGMVSHGDGCAKKDKPSLYANLWYFKNWIESTVISYIEKNCKSK